MESRRLPSSSSLEKKLITTRDSGKEEGNRSTYQSCLCSKRSSRFFPSISPFPKEWYFRDFSLLCVCVHLESGRGDKLSSSEKHYLQNLLKVMCK
ncbi:hypothetical protein Patl1_19557 [Pistacia atlantica]|uniref:Uncharacterized protein n=1 Tax=Pistacia atlantica TaxID=434234 RepID=A0ACC1C3K0_9ROSI|nr:hypothetical protein Patl1_19557 [Pistacia atlantica]